MKDSHNSSRDATPRISQHRAASTHRSPARPSRLREHRPDFVQTLISTPVNQSVPTESTRNNIDPRNIDPRNIDPRNIDPRNTDPRSIEPRNRDHHDARDRSRDHRSNERPTHEGDRGDSGDVQRNSYHSGMSNSMSRPSSSPKVPTFDGTVSAQFQTIRYPVPQNAMMNIRKSPMDMNTNRYEKLVQVLLGAPKGPAPTMLHLNSANQDIGKARRQPSLQ